MTNRHQRFIFGCIFEQGLGMEKKPSLAYPLYALSANEEHDLALCYAANCLRRGIGTKKDLKKSFQFYERAAENGYSAAFIINFNPSLRFDSSSLFI